uniref:Taste receptor type 2 n=1 Tax=Cavia porcellus TaxID=10141 RepID=H0VVR6_CAVPO
MEMHHLIIHFLIVVTQFLTGVLTNGFIVVVNVVDFIKHRQMAPLDLLLSCLATSRITLQMLIILSHLVLLSFVKMSVLTKLNTVLMFVSDWGLWLATWLGVFYCARITTISHPMFFWLKRRISKLVPCLILGSTLYSFIMSGFHEKQSVNLIQNVMLNFFSKNATHLMGIESAATSVLIFHFMVPLLVFLIALLVLIVTLGRHTWRMRAMSPGTRDPRSRAPLRALLSILSFLILYFSHYMMSILFMFQTLQFGSFLFEFCSLTVAIYPSIHSVILILGNAKLKQSAKRFLLCGQ